ncbi:hypothetical protein KA047_01825 [Candidatus Saccharibacteria bacterium]|nr:hypothetical protein [Candidatus Saccharibacteria bacterium]
MARLPVPGSDDGDWGDILNEYLAVSHNSDGTPKDIGVIADKYTLPGGGIPASDLTTDAENKIENSVQKTVVDAKGDLLVASAADTVTKLTAGTNGHVLTADSGEATGLKWAAVASGGATAAENSVYAQRAALLEPMAIEPLLNGNFTYTIGANETKWLVSSWNTRLGSSGRLDMREAREPIPLRNTTLTGISAAPGERSTAMFIDPSAPTYTDPKETYYQRTLDISELPTKYLPVEGGDTYAAFMPGPYGNILVSFTFHDVAWFAIVTPRGRLESLLPIHDEISDSGTDDIRMSRRLWMPVSKNIMNGMLTGAAGGPQALQSGLTYVILPSDWSAVADPIGTYVFRDDFMGSSLDTATVWNRVQAGVGTVEINTDFAALRINGGAGWGADGLYTQQSFARADGLTYLVDVFINGVDFITGFHDGTGYSYTDFSHGVLFSSLGTDIYIFEDGVSRGAVGDFTTTGTYRVRITLNGAGATYEIQGGTEYEPIGSSTWDDITPGTTTSAVNTLHVGASAENNYPIYISDVRVYNA